MDVFWKSQWLFCVVGMLMAKGHYAAVAASATVPTKPGFANGQIQGFSPARVAVTTQAGNHFEANAYMGPYGGWFPVCESYCAFLTQDSDSLDGLHSADWFCPGICAQISTNHSTPPANELHVPDHRSDVLLDVLHLGRGGHGFSAAEYARLNSRRLEHLASLNLDLAGQRVLEVGSGVGDHTSFFVDRDCDVTSIDGRRENLALAQLRMKLLGPHVQNRVETAAGDLERAGLPSGTWDIVYCYGVLYHMQDPLKLLKELARRTGKLLLVETAVIFGGRQRKLSVPYEMAGFAQGLGRNATFLSRSVIAEQLQSSLGHVYFPRTQPAHPAFPVNWNPQEDPEKRLQLGKRTVFVGSRTPLQRLEGFFDDGYIPQHQLRQGAQVR